MLNVGTSPLQRQEFRHVISAINRKIELQTIMGAFRGSQDELQGRLDCSRAGIAYVTQGIRRTDNIKRFVENKDLYQCCKGVRQPMNKFRFDPKARYRMPVMFGPTVGPRQGPNGETFDAADAPYTMTTVKFLSQADALCALLPSGFELAGEPIVTVEHTILHDLAWLAGRSYSMLGIKLPVVFHGEQERLQGALLTVLWENRAEPILSGREELGFNKVYCELPDPVENGNERICRASWDGFEFLKLRVSGLNDVVAPTAPRSDGVLHYAYMPPMGANTSHEERSRVMLSPSPLKAVTPDVFQVGEAELDIHKASFEQMPTMFQIVNVLADLPMLEMRGGSFVKSRGKGDLSNQRMVG